MLWNRSYINVNISLNFSIIISKRTLVILILSVHNFSTEDWINWGKKNGFEYRWESLPRSWEEYSTKEEDDTVDGEMSRNLEMDTGDLPAG